MAFIDRNGEIVSYANPADEALAHAVATRPWPPRVSSCPFCSDNHAPGKCPRVAGGGPWDELREARSQIAELEIRLAEYRQVNTLATNALEKYFALYGALPEVLK